MDDNEKLTEHVAEHDVTEQELSRTVTIQKVVDSLAQGKTIVESVTDAGISERTWKRWRKEGYIQDAVNAKFQDVTSGVKDLVSNALVKSTKVLTELACGKIPEDTSIDGVMAPRDVIAAHQQLITLWTKLGGDSESKEREQQALLDELRHSTTNILTVHIDTVNIGDERQPIPVPTGARAEFIEGELIEGSRE